MSVILKMTLIFFFWRNNTMAGTYQRANIYTGATEQDRGGGVFEDVMSLFIENHPVRFTRRKHRLHREKQGIDDEDIWDVYFEPENLVEREDYFLLKDGKWYECMNFRPQRDHLGVLHHWTSKVKQIPTPNVAIQN